MESGNGERTYEFWAVGVEGELGLSGVEEDDICDIDLDLRWCLEINAFHLA